jgi:uncharacterized membrane protein YbhN (UPF0104 family)
MTILARVVAQQAGHYRGVKAFMSAARTTAASCHRVLHQLWLEVTGFVFLFLAVIGGLKAAQEYSKYEAGRTTAGRVVLAICFCATFAYFGLSSFWRVRRKRRLTTKVGD